MKLLKREFIAINMLKEWKLPETVVFHVVVAEEDAEGMIDPTRLADPVLTDEQKRQLDEILSKFSDVVCTSTGKVARQSIGSRQRTPHLLALYPIG